MSCAGIGELATDSAEVIHVDEGDVVDERSVDVTDEIAFEQQAAASIRIRDGPCATKAMGEVVPERPVVARRDLSEAAMCTELLRHRNVAEDAGAMQ